MLRSCACVAPVHMRAPLMSMPMKFLSGNRSASPMVYSPRPQPSSMTMGLVLPKKCSCHRPLRSKVAPAANSLYDSWKTCVYVSISANFFSLFLLMMQAFCSVCKNTVFCPKWQTDLRLYGGLYVAKYVIGRFFYRKTIKIFCYSKKKLLLCRRNFK